MKRKSQPRTKSIGSYSKKLATGHCPIRHNQYTEWIAKKERQDKRASAHNIDSIDSIDSIDTDTDTDTYLGSNYEEYTDYESNQT